MDKSELFRSLKFWLGVCNLPTDETSLDRSMFRNLLIAGLAILLTACVPIPTEEPPTPGRPAWMILRRSSPR